jgi:hypothetical protein
MTMTDTGSKAGDRSVENAEDAGALYILGTRYSTGRDVEQDLIAAHKWFNLAAMMGHDEARACRAELAREMSAADIAEAQRQARAWLWNRAQAKPAADAPASTAAAPTPINREPTTATANAGRNGWQNSRSLCA